MRTWITQFETPALTSEGRTNTGIYKLLWTTDGTALTWYPQGWNHGARPELWLRPRFHLKSFVHVQQVKMMMFSVVLSIGLRLNKMWYWNINQAKKTRTNERHDETSERGRNCDTANLKPDDFHVRSMSTWWRFWPVRLPADSMLEAKATQDYESSSGVSEAASDTRTCKERYRHADGRYFTWFQW